MVSQSKVKIIGVRIVRKYSIDIIVIIFQKIIFRERRSSLKLTAIIEREGDGFVSLCPELDIASQGHNIEEARDNLREALELFFETASSEEIKKRLHEEIFVTQVEVAVG